MKLVILAVALFVCATSATRLGLPRLPLSLLLKGNVPLVDLDNRIVGGIEVPQNAIPFQLTVQRKGFGGGYSQSCGASILSETKALCAAHCVATDLKVVLVVAGEHNLNVATGREQNLTVQSWVKHPNYGKPKTYSNDFSIITFNEKIKFNEFAKPITLAEDCSADGIPSGIKEGDELIVSGWGTTTSGGSIPDTLRAVKTPYISWQECNKNSHYLNEIDSSMLCAGKPEGGVDSCQGDSGGPLYQNVTATSTKLTQYGVVSWGYGCAVEDTPGVYSSVCSARQWIDKEVASL